MTDARGDDSTVSRIAARFRQLRQAGRAGFIPFITAGDPDLPTAREILLGLPAAGADLIELGMPFSDPMADGPAIQAANLRALQNGMTLQKTLDLVAHFRRQDDRTPVVLMGYYNPIYRYGVPAFIDAALDAGVDGLIIVDLPPEEDDELCHPCRTANLDWIRLTTPTTHEQRVTRVLKHSSGFVYYVAITGTTGTRSAEPQAVQADIERIRQHTCLPIAVGFGIKTRQQVSRMAQLADAVVVGSAIVGTIAAERDKQRTDRHIIDSVLGFTAELAAGIGDPPPGR